jgi:hypothetical protein
MVEFSIIISVQQSRSIASDLKGRVRRPGQGNGVERVVAMKLFERNAGKKTRGQTMVEFALVLPIIVGDDVWVMEFGRFYSSM